MAQTFNGKPGDLIEISHGLYNQWAVYIGENEVIHFTTDGGQSSGSSASLSSTTGKVKREKFTDVVGNHRYQVNNLLDNRRQARDPSFIVKEACAMVDTKLRYNVDTYNSKHFATEMRYGKFEGNPGDLIKINRGLYKHWAVYIGGQEVIHFTTDDCQSSGSSESLSSSNGKVKREKLADVVGTHRYQVNNLLHTRRQARDPSIIVEEACAMVDRELRYNVDTYNSKHFATEMRYGKFEGNPGDLIKINRGLYKHWAVYIGGQEVIHFTTDDCQSSGSSESLSSSNGKVKREKLADVVGTHRYQVNNLLHTRRQARDPSIIVEEACAMVDRELRYNVDTYNSEHFATEMRYGKFNGKQGDLIEIFHWGYQHWAVYIGGQEVVHLVNECGQSSGWFELLSSSSSGSLGKVKREKLADVLGNHRYEVNNLLDKKYKALDPSDIEKAALAKVGSKQYNLATYNCEHFATEMRYGKAESRQVKAAVISGVTVGAGAGAGALVAGAPVVAVGATGAAVAAGAFALCKVPWSSLSSS